MVFVRWVLFSIFYYSVGFIGVNPHFLPPVLVRIREYAIIGY